MQSGRMPCVTNADRALAPVRAITFELSEIAAARRSIIISMNSITTPAFLVDRNVVQRNCDRMREKALHSGVAFRPHVKTHKSVEVGRMQFGGQVGPITVSTMAEAEFFAEQGFRDITYAVPVAPDKLHRVAALQRKVDRISILLDHEVALRTVESFAAANDVTFDVWLKVDCGYHRAGVDPADPDSVRLALAIAQSASLRFQGLLTHAGHSYNVRSREEVARIAAEETAALSRFRALLAPEGWSEVVARSIGSTPTTSVVTSFSDCDEVRPGNYVFYDAFQATLGSCTLADCAVSVLATVIGSYPERGNLLIDAGALALSKDLSPDHLDPRFGYGLVCDLQLRPLPLRLIALSQEHGKIEADPAAIRQLPVGARVRVVPNHSCLTAALFDRYHVVEGSAVVDEWRPVRGW